MLGRQRPRGLSIRLALCVFIAALSGACKSADPRTQVMLVLEADDEVRARATELTVAFESRSEFDHVDGAPYEQTFPTIEGADPFWPYSIALVPKGNDARRSYWVTATLYEGGTEIARLRARSGFLPQRTLELKLLFSAACLDEKSLSCGEQETCYDGECWASEIDVNTLPSLGGDGAIAAADGGIPNSSDVRTGSQSRADGGSAGAGGKSAPGRRGSAGASGADAADGGMPDKPARIIGGNCGDGVWNDEEECDTAIAQGMPGACPVLESCRTGGCMPEQLEGAACKMRCMEYPVQSAIAGDDCCLPGTDSSTDPDCATMATCGNGIIEMSEYCDGDCPTDPATCPRSNECQMAKIEGDAASCSAHCVMVDVEVCMTGDGCCGTSGCTNATDGECSASCGNGTVEAALGELCEPTSPDSPCPSCDDGDPCTEDITTGTPENCNVRCNHEPITRTMNGDMCCPPGRGNANNDSDCAAMCGNNIIERGEFCDGLCPTQASQCEDFIACTSNKLVAGPCGMRCGFDPILTAANSDGCCPFGADATTDNDCPPSCGNLVIERGEMCDGNCPTSCPADTDNNACTANVVVSTGCQRRCESRPLAANTQRMDGCCPPGANYTTDSDCPPPACAAPREMCGADCVNTQISGQHCGSCSNACVANQVCMNGTCQVTDCTSGSGRCGGATSECVPLNTITNCGGCGNACTAPEECNGSTCVAPPCPSGRDYCGGVACIPLNAEPNCGVCGRTCNAPEVCNGTGCAAPACPSGEDRCDGIECMPLNAEPNCGVCGRTCNAPEVCNGTGCAAPACPSGQDRCGGIACIPLNAEPNCGVCGRTCTAPEECNGTGCAVPACPRGQDRCGGTACLPLNTPANCGGCGITCTAPEECNGTGCAVPACPRGQDRCGGNSCVPLNTSANCGSCGNDCRGEQTCLGSSCGCASGTTCGTSCCGAGQICNGSSCENPPTEPTPDPPVDPIPTP